MHIASAIVWSTAYPSNLISLIINYIEARTIKVQSKLLKISKCELCELELCKSLAPVIFWTSAQMHCFCSQTCRDRWLHLFPLGLTREVAVKWMVTVWIAAAYMLWTVAKPGTLIISDLKFREARRGGAEQRDTTLLKNIISGFELNQRANPIN